MTDSSLIVSHPHSQSDFFAAAFVAAVAAVADDMLRKQMAHVFGSISPMRMCSKKAALQKR